MTSKLITPESPLLVPPLLAAEIGLTEALILQQIHYFCQISKHIKSDGRRWFWKTLNDWSQTLPFLKVSTIRRAIANLRDNFKLIDVCRHSEKTWYQANWFTVNVENVEALWNRICQNQQMDLSILETSNCSLVADDIKDFPSKDFSPQQHAAAEEEKNEEVDWEAVARETETWEKAQITSFLPESVDQTPHSTPLQQQPQISHLVDEQQKVDSINQIDPHEDQFSQAEVEVISTLDNPTKQEIREVCNDLKRLRINPEPCLGVVKKYWENVPGALARVKQAIHQGWCDNPTGLFINSCKSGIKPKNTVTTEVSAWFEWARGQRIVLAMSGQVVYTLDGEAVEIGEMMGRYPFKGGII